MSIIAVCGKGGAGKTTVSAILARGLARRPGSSLLLVDADPAGGLALALGMPPRRTVNDLRLELLREAAAGGGADALDLAATADHALMEILEERDRAALLCVGRPEEEGCYCKLNSFLRAAIETLGARFHQTLVDAEAGIEQINRRVMRSVSHLLLVTDPSQRGLQVVRTLKALAPRALAPGKVGLVVNRVRDPAAARRLAADAGLPLLSLVPEDPAIADADAAGRPLWELPPCPALERLQHDLLQGDWLAPA
jgi:CO dehydrogenase maturation factor